MALRIFTPPVARYFPNYSAPRWLSSQQMKLLLAAMAPLAQAQEG